MRQITQRAKQAFDNNTPFCESNTQVIVMRDITEMYLFGNKIARKFGDEIKITLAGWNTNTTRERLNAFASVYTRQGQAYINGKAVSDTEWITL